MENALVEMILIYIWTCNTTRSMSGANMMVYIHDVEAQKRNIETGLTI